MKPTILINKYGGVFRTRASQGASSTGEQGETEGIIRHLVKRDDVNIVYFGQYYGHEYCDVVRPSVARINPFARHPNDCPSSLQKEGFESDVHRLGKYVPIIGMINVAGYPVTVSTLDNPKMSNVQLIALKYCAPVLNALQTFGIPRVMVNNDPRTYPRDQEMSWGWHRARPAALLDQCEADFTMTVGGKKYRRKSVWARAESWAYLERCENTDEIPCTVISHAHIKDGLKFPGRNTAWANVLTGPLPAGTRVYGKGWEHYEGYDPEMFPGPIKPSEVGPLLARSTCNPAVSAGPGFYTGKPYVCNAVGCIPLLYGDDSDRFTWDPLETFLAFDDPWRIKKPGDLGKLIKELEDKSLRAEMRSFWDANLKPDWTMLDQVVDDLVTGKPLDFETYGGYRAL